MSIVIRNIKPNLQSALFENQQWITLQLTFCLCLFSLPWYLPYSALEYVMPEESNINLSAIRTIRVLRPLRAINRIPSKYAFTLIPHHLHSLKQILWYRSNNIFSRKETRLTCSLLEPSGTQLTQYWECAVKMTDPFSNLSLMAHIARKLPFLQK